MWTHLLEYWIIKYIVDPRGFGKLLEYINVNFWFLSKKIISTKIPTLPYVYFLII